MGVIRILHGPRVDEQDHLGVGQLEELLMYLVKLGLLKLPPDKPAPLFFIKEEQAYHPDLELDILEFPEDTPDQR